VKAMADDEMTARVASREQMKEVERLLSDEAREKLLDLVRRSEQLNRETAEVVQAEAARIVADSPDPSQRDVDSIGAAIGLYLVQSILEEAQIREAVAASDHSM
jgi:hypothetical protein